MNKIKLSLLVPFVVMALGATFTALAWVNPTAAPPGANPPGPLNVGSVWQSRQGGLEINAIGAHGSALLIPHGNVGIGTTTPMARLHVVGDIVQNNTNTLRARNAAGVVETWMWPRWDNNAMYTNFGAGGWFIRNTNSEKVMALTHTGNVGVGTDVPTARFVVEGIGTTTAATMNVTDTIGTSRFFVRDDGNVGIGTTAPTQRLDIEGQIRIRGGSPAAGRVLTSAADGTATWTVPAGGLPTGTASQTLRHDGTSWVANSNIFNTGTNVGIGTTGPLFGRVIIEDATVPLAFRETGVAVNAGGLWRMPLDGGNFRWDVNTAAAGDFSTHISPLTITSAGNVGIGTMAPAARLHVTGGDIVAGQTNEEWLFHTRVGAGGDFLQITDRDAGGAWKWGQGLTIHQGGNVGIGTATPDRRLTVAGTIRSAGSDAPWTTVNWGRALELSQGQTILWGMGATGVARGVGSTSDGVLFITRSTANDASAVPTYDMVVNTVGNVGIGTTSPGDRLHVVGTGRFEGGANIVRTWLRNPDTPTNNSFLNSPILRITAVDDSDTTTAIVRREQNFDIRGIMTDVNTGRLVLSPFGTERVSILSTGNVGIGITGPGDRLHVAGTVRADSFRPTSDRVWGRGRTGVSATAECSVSGVNIGRGNIAVQWDNAEAGCPLNTWVCTAAERGAGACGTGMRNIIHCDDVTATSEFAWMSNRWDDLRGQRMSFAGGTVGAALQCWSKPVWCCW